MKTQNMTGKDFLTYIRSTYKNAFYNHPESAGARLYESATNLLFPNGMPQINLIGHCVLDEATSYNDILGYNAVDLDNLKDYLNSVCIHNFN